MKTIRDLFEHFKKNPQQFLTILTIFFSTSLLLIFSKRDATFRDQDKTESDALTSTLSSQLSTQVINHFSWFLGAAFHFLTEFGKLPGAMAQQTPAPTSVTYPPAQPITATFPSIEINSVNNISNIVRSRSNKNATLIYLLGANGYCFATVDTSDLFYPRILSTYGKTTEFSNHCSAITLNRNESYAFLANQKNGGITTVDISHPESPTFVSNLPGFNAYAVTLSQDEKYAFLASIGPTGYRIITIDITDLKNPRLSTSRSFPWSNAVSYIMSDSRLKLAMDIQSMQNDHLAFSWSAYIPSERSYETAINMIDASNVSHLQMKGRLSWAGQLPTSSHPLNVVTQFYLSKDEKRLFLIASNKVPRHPSLSPDTPISGPKSVVSIIDISNAASLQMLDGYVAPSADAAVFLSDEKRAIVADKNRGVDIINFDRFIKADPPIVESQWEIKGFSNLWITPDNRFLLGVTGDALKIFLLRSALVMPINLFTLKTNIAAYALNIKLIPDHINAFVGRGASISLLTLNDANNPTRLLLQYPDQMKGYGGNTISLNSNDTQLFATYAAASQCHLFDVSNPRNPIRSNNFFSGDSKTAAVFSPDDQYIFASYLNKIDVLNASKISHNISKIFTQQNVRRLLSSKNKKILFASNGDTISFINFENITALTEIGTIRWDGASEMALSSNERFLFVGYSSYGETGLAVFDIRDLNASILLGTVMTGSAINQIKTSSDDRYLYLATNAGTFCVDVSDPARPEIIFNAPTVSNALGIDLNENANLLISANYDSVNIFGINQQPFVAIPVLQEQLTTDHPVLKSGENNIGKLLFLNSQIGSEQTTSQHQPLIQEIYLVDGETVSAIPNEFVINKKTGEFNIVPSEEMAGKTLTLRFKLGDHFFSDMSIPVVPGSGLTLKPTSTAPSNLPSTPITTIAPTTHASTVVAPTVSTISPTSIPTVAPTPRATDPIQDITFPPSLMPGETLAPSFTSPSENLLQINTTDQKIQIVSKATSLTLKIKLPKPNIGQFMLTSPNLGSVITTFNEPLGILTAVGSADDLNTLLQHLRFSLNDHAYNQSQILLAVSQDGESAWTLALGNVNQLGENHAPVMTNSTYPNQSAEIGKSLVMPLTGNFQDPDNDPLNYEVTLSDGAPLPTWIQKRNNVLAGLCSQPEALQLRVTATDGYKLSPESAAMNVTCQYFPPTVLNPVPDFIAKIGQGFVYSIPLTTFSGSGLHYDAKLENGYPLPLGMSFDPNRFQLSGVINSDATYNITISATDAFQSSVNTTFKLNFFDHPPTVAKPISTQIVKAGKTVALKIPANTFFDLDDDVTKLTLSITQADGAPLPSWINFDVDTKTLHVTPGADMPGKSMDLKIKASDGYKLVETNFTLTVPTNQPPVIKERLPNVTAIAGTTFIYRIASNAFSSPENFTLTYLANLLNENNKGNAPIPEWLQLDDNVLSGTPGKDHVGNILIKVTAVDLLNDKVNQVFRIQITLSLWDQIQYWLLRVGVPVSAVITLYGIYEYYEKRSILLNTLTGNRYLLKKPFNENNELQVKCSKNLTLYPEYLQRIQPHELDCLNRFLTMLVWPSRYLRERHTLIPIEKPDWIRFNDVTNTLKVYPEVIPIGTTKSVIVQLRTASGRIYWQIKVNPTELTQIELITSDPSNALTPENSENNNNGGESQWQQPLLNQVPEKVTANPLSTSRYHLQSSLFGQSTNASPLPTNRVQRATYCVA